MKEIIKRIPIIGPWARRINAKLFNKPSRFLGSRDYWIRRYESGGNSGSGSYGKFAEFKAEVINGFVKENHVSTIIEFGCGDGNQLRLAEYPSYIGFDISPHAINRCKDIYYRDQHKTFKLINEYDGETAQLTLSLDVIYHLIEDEVFIQYMEMLFDTSERFVIIYSSNADDVIESHAPHIKFRHFLKWVEDNRPSWTMTKHIPNRFPFKGDHKTGSIADSYIFTKSTW